MRIQEIEMTQRRYFSPQGAPRAAVPAETPGNSTPRIPRGNHAPRYAVGSPEHVALMDAVRREFPEIFEAGAACGSGEWS